MDLITLNLSVKLALIFSGVYLWVGMLTGVWKYVQISRSELARAHYYVDIAHRSSLLYAPASLILAVMAYCSSFQEIINLLCVIVNLVFFSFSIASYVLHGWLKDTTNQFKQPHQLGAVHLPKILLRLAMILLVIGEIFATGILLLGMIKGLL
ncbi:MULTISPECIES: hypothetical protein [Acinetobacter]|jgi:hypothetical protein|uniref:Uncharacterized protein n=2 Tax=Acinetobacter bereziniae TaxID=106648 RepID=A0A430GLA2_ACIBZ|nr:MULTISPECIES: hypothetical protein [Acinetobacter]MEC8123043.1 hypothetical protein [Pseudomonadota bacterium]ATZ64064.1 hypothetical protein BSR55_12165 [Acinetobacter bereziniae]ELW86835.1 hypothetical protein ACINWC743_0558 [Acinetobacter sp. WC-743]ENV95363.1 hypothetical protein F938_02380 [Acinetobacter bereziniae LMG 1003 = CIP 70.12]KKW77627.1 membrane protein [Acinetobacter sp. Ag2]